MNKLKILIVNTLDAFALVGPIGECAVKMMEDNSTPPEITRAESEFIILGSADEQSQCRCYLQIPEEVPILGELPSAKFKPQIGQEVILLHKHSDGHRSCTHHIWRKINTTDFRS